MRTLTKERPRTTKPCLRLRGRPICVSKASKPLTTAENAIARELMQLAADDTTGCSITSILLNHFNDTEEEKSNGRQ